MNIRQYTPEDIEAVVAVFRSNIPKYFGPVEEPGLREFLSTARSDEYFVFEIGDNVVGSGGIALNSDDTVSLCWGMICKEHLGTGLGRRMTQFRIDLSREDEATRNRYGRHAWGQRCLMARRLVEAGVSFVTMVLENPMPGEAHPPCSHSRAAASESPTAALNPVIRSTPMRSKTRLCSRMKK